MRIQRRTTLSVTSLSDHLLIEVYNKAIELKLEPQFIDLLEKEINKRGLFST
ncbi:sporulation histidine kinase inhibitor Sda [Pseudalkalibacillus sp. JSM 102089]|uniref:sporulation histidine kinase inhibitor Sda n=1 Tax=Pseudalkalibacillus sp. JSM 102089 TaxID=3229856 RepID=UPI003523DACC